MKDRIRELMHQSPFLPFTLHVADGRVFRIKHPDYIFAGPSLGFEVLIDGGDGHLHYLSSHQLTGIDLETAEQVA